MESKVTKGEDRAQPQDIWIVAFCVICPPWPLCSPSSGIYARHDTTQPPPVLGVRNGRPNKKRLLAASAARPPTRRHAAVGLFVVPLRPRPNDWSPAAAQISIQPTLPYHQQAPQQLPAFASIGRTRSSATRDAGSSHSSSRSEEACINQPTTRSLVAARSGRSTRGSHVLRRCVVAQASACRPAWLCILAGAGA